jgi:quinol monooxygenase YgiN
MNKVAMIVKTRTQPGKRAEVQAAYERMLGPRAEANDAQEVVVWAADAADPDAFYLFEIYRDRASMEANGQAPWFFEYLGAVGPLLDGKPEVSLAEPQWAKGVRV